MSPTPPLPRGAPDEVPIDRAFRFAFAGDHEAALRTAASLVKQQLDAPLPLFVTGQALAALGAKDGACTALEISADRAVESSNLPLAIAAFAELRRLGIDTSSRISAAARAYAKGSPRLKAAPPAPPSIGAKHEHSALPAAMTGPALVAQVEQILEYAKASLDGDQSETARTPLAPQRLFSSFGADASAAMMRAFDTRIVPRGAVLIEEGTTGSEAFLLARGELEVQRGTGERQLLLARLGAGTLFGEMALLARAPRAATVKAALPSIVLVIDQKALGAVAADAPEVAAAFAEYCRRRMVSNLLRTSAILSALKEPERVALMERFVTKTYDKSDRVIAQGSSSQGLHIVASGQVAVQRIENGDPVVIARLGVGEVVGEVAMVLRRPANADVVAEQPTVTMHLPQEGFMDLVREHPALLSRLYELAVKRDEETSSIVAQDAADADDLII